MGFKKATVLASLLMVCFVLAAQSAKADSITFTEVGDNIVLSGTGRFSTLSCLPALEPTCSVTIGAPAANSLFGNVSGFHNVANAGLIYTFGATQPGTGHTQLSDVLLVFNNLNGATITFFSDPPGAGGLGEAPLPCLSTIDGVQVPCDTLETGGIDTPGSINWTSGSPDSISFVSDVTPSEVVPEPTSLMLFGSGFAIAGGFLRRRRRLMTPLAS